MNDDLGKRMKGYEDSYRFYLPRRLPLVIRLDGKAFHTYTRGLSRPYDEPLMSAMNEVAKKLCKEVQNTVVAYTQSDEISLLLIDYKSRDSGSWFESNLQKVVSVSAGLASAKMTALSSKIFNETKEACFDARVFVLPESEVINYFIWRQKDWIRNSLSMLAQSIYSSKELHGKKRDELHEMCFQKGYNWANLHSHLKNGRLIIKEQTQRLREIQQGHGSSGPDKQLYFRGEWKVREDTPVFSESQDYMNHLFFQSYGVDK